MLVKGEICPLNPFGENLGGQIENVCPLRHKGRASAWPAKFCIEVINKPNIVKQC